MIRKQSGKRQAIVGTIQKKEEQKKKGGEYEATTFYYVRASAYSKPDKTMTASSTI